jgi:hypothetical protein
VVVLPSIPTAVYEGSFFPKSSPTFVVGGVLDGNYSTRIEVESLCGFDLLFLYNQKHMESPCIAIFISNQQKHHVFLVIFYVFSTTKSEKKRAEQVLPRGGGVGIAYK